MATKYADDVLFHDSANQNMKSDSKNLADWMANLPVHLLSLPLHKLAIPGSHDSGSYELQKQWGIGPDADPSLRQIASTPVIGILALDSIDRWSKCQNLSILEQLRAGVRYLDIRVAYNEPTEDLHFIHSFYGPKISSCMEQVKEFLGEHEKEVVLLDFNHFYNMEMEHHLQLITYLLHVFEGKLCQFSSLNALTLKSMWELGTRVIIFYHDNIAAEFPELWPKRMIRSPWANTMDVEKCLSHQAGAACTRDLEKGFHVCQMVLTPDSKEIIQKFNSSLQVECARKLNRQLPDWLNSETVKGLCGMIFIVDFVDEGSFLSSVVKLNQ